MNKLTRQDLYSLEHYAELRADYRAKVMQHKKNRRLALGEHLCLYFEDKLTIQYQIQEMLRAESIFEPAAIEEEIIVYTPLIPDGSNWKATFMIEYTDENERKAALAKLIGVEKKVWIKVDGFEPVWSIADEDLDRENEEKTSAVHFLRFELSRDMVEKAIKGASISIGVDHPVSKLKVNPIPENVRTSLVNDLR